MTQLEMFEERVEGHTVERAPWTVEVSPSLSLLSAVIVVNKLIKHKLRGFRACHTCQTRKLFHG